MEKQPKLVSVFLAPMLGGFTVTDMTYYAIYDDGQVFAINSALRWQRVVTLPAWPIPVGGI